MYYLIMTIGDEPFIEVPIDFTGKDTVDDRASFLSDMALVLETEYVNEIAGLPVTYHYTRESSFNDVRITDFFMMAFEVKINARRFLKNKRQNREGYREAS